MSNSSGQKVYMPLMIGDWLKGTRGMRAEVRGVYLNLLLYQWDNGFIPDDMDELCLIDPELPKVWDKIKDKFKPIGEGKLLNEKNKEVREFWQKQSKNGKKGGRKSKTEPKVEAKTNPNPNPKTKLHNDIDFDIDFINEVGCAFESHKKSEKYFLGNIPDDIQKYAESLEPSGLKADDWQRVVASDIQAMGYEIQLETACPYLKQDGHRTEGFIDIRAVKGNDVVCIECDGRVTTYDSIAKIHTYAVIMKEYEDLEYSGMVILRDPKPAKIVIQANVPAKPLTTSSTAIIKYPFQSPAFMEQWARWLKYRKDIKKPYKSDDSQQEQLNVLARYDEAIAIEMIKQSIANTWQGIFEVKNGPSLKAVVTSKSKLDSINLDHIE